MAGPLGEREKIVRYPTDKKLKSLLQLKRTSASQISSVPGKGAYRIGAEIPPVRWITVELQMKTRELARYASTHAVCTGNLCAGFDSENNTGIRNMAYHRRLCFAVLSPDLDRVSTLNEKAATIERFYHKHQDHGATYLFHRTLRILKKRQVNDL